MPPVETNLTSTSNLVKCAVVIVAFFPGIAVYRELIEVPPDVVGVAKILSFSVSILVLICIPLFSESIYRIGKRKVALFAMLSIFLGAACLLGYLQFAKTHIVTAVTDEGPKKFIIPLRPSAQINEIVSRMEGTRLDDTYVPAIETSPRREELKAMLAEQSLGSLIVMVTLLILSQVLLVAPPVAAAWRLTGPAGSKLAPAANERDSSPPRGDRSALPDEQVPDVH